MRYLGNVTTAVFLTLGAAGVSSTPSAATETPAELALERAIEYHDPGAVWARRAVRLSIRSTYGPNLTERLGYASRVDDVVLEPGSSRFRYRSARGDHVIEITGVGDALDLVIDGARDPDPRLAKALRLAPERLPTTRDYLLYLYGLPMKLRDPGTVLDPTVRTDRFQDREVLALRVTYDPEIGGDTWYFYLDPESHALVGYRFYHDEAAGDGEYIELDGETVDEATGLRIPGRRRWYTNADDEYLGMDEVIDVAVD